MFDNSRQDELLNRLKSCVGALKLETSAPISATKQNIPAFKENQMQFKEASTSHPLTSPHKMQNLGSLGYERKPMVSLNNESLTTRSRYGEDYISEKIKQQVIVNAKSNPAGNVEQSKLNEQLLRFKSGLNNFKPKQPEPTLQLDKYRMAENHRQNEVKSSIARRYSQMQNQKSATLNVAQSSYSYLRSNKNIEKSFDNSKVPLNPKIIEASKAPKYRQQLQQRKNLINEDYTLMSQKPLFSARKQVATGVIRKQNVSYSIPKQSTTATNFINRTGFSSQTQPQPQYIAPNMQQKNTRMNERTPIHQTLKRSLENQEGDCTALAKLKKISELNEKINQRIRNIINVFEQQK